MSKKALNVSILILSAVLILGSFFGFYNTELERTRAVGENRSYVYCAERTLELADAAGVADEKPASHAADTSGMSKMQADLTWLADYNTELSRLDRAYDELSSSPALNGAESYAAACSTAISYHQAQLDDINGRANAMNAVCAAAFILGVSGAVWSAVRPMKKSRS